jgi:hypothetical protein
MTQPSEPREPSGESRPESSPGESQPPAAWEPPASPPAAWEPPPSGPAWGSQIPPAQPGYNVLAILSLVFAFVFAPVGIVLGHIARRQIGRTGEQGNGLAMAGLILSYIFTGLVVLACCGGVAASLLAGVASI